MCYSGHPQVARRMTFVKQGSFNRILYFSLKNAQQMARMDTVLNPSLIMNPKAGQGTEVTYIAKSLLPTRISVES